ncbi:uncharacterized protein LOC120074766 [Benincasa hispida]|uniref:uncharacterized protein LOC120074766 n=1 Tax=Benincasa hispida TaxID=102211 RepID=UPI0019016411|nr:uncharacterized protein LOC120074766 [Benincasa hispida]
MVEHDQKNKAPQEQQLGESATPTLSILEILSKWVIEKDKVPQETPTISILEIVSKSPKMTENTKAPQEEKFGKSASPTILRIFNWDSVQPIRPKELKVAPSLVGLTVEEATKKIKEEMGEEVKIEVIPPGYSCTQELPLSFDRVKLVVDSSGKVLVTPVLS